MIDKKAVLNNIEKRKLFRRYEIKKTIYKALIKTFLVTPKDKLSLCCKLQRLPINSSLTKIRKKCILTNRSRGILKQFRLSRISFREIASQGIINGIYKSSW